MKYKEYEEKMKDWNRNMEKNKFKDPEFKQHFL